jgi:hypothetical protein
MSIKEHILLSHNLIKNFLKKDYICVDATLGNGYDTLFLANLFRKYNLKKIIGFDIQKKAIENSTAFLKKNIDDSILKNIFFYLDSHENFSKYLNEKVNLFIYNLGYLPRSDKTITTLADSTIKSLKSAFEYLSDTSAICITLYPGHLNGEVEKNEVLKYLETADYKKYSILHYNWINKDKSPSVIWIEKLRD